MSDIFDFHKAIAAGQAGMDRTLEANPIFKDAIARHIDNFPHGHVFNTNQIRKYWRGPWPGHVNAWGAVTNAAVKRGTIEKIGLDIPESVKSHGSMIFQWRRV